MINADKLRDKIQRIKENLVQLEIIRKESFTQFCESPLYAQSSKTTCRILNILLPA